MSKELLIKCPASLDSLSDIMEKVRTAGSDFNLNNKQMGELELAFEEAIVNVCNYSYPDSDGEVEITAGTDDSNRLVIQIVDSGEPFDPLAQADPDIESDIADRPIGGLGIFLIKKLMDDVRYRRENSSNILELVIKRKDG